MLRFFKRFLWPSIERVLAKSKSDRMSDDLELLVEQISAQGLDDLGLTGFGRLNSGSIDRDELHRSLHRPA